jgi:phosphoribosyl 1,2-cyclic phosphate phosphodiesterase
LNLRVIVLGCGGSAGVPQIGGEDGTGHWGECDPTEPRNRRSRTSILLAGQGGQLLVDTSPDMRTQLLANEVARVDAILFTHAHADHIMGLDDVRGLNRLTGLPMPVAASEQALGELRRRFDYAFMPWTSQPMFFRPVLAPQTVAPGDTIILASHELTLFDQVHGRVRSLGFRAGGFGYSTDASDLPDASLAALEGVDTWLVGCFQRDPHMAHADLAQVTAWARRIGARRTILTHMGTDLDWGWMQRNLPPGIEPAFDGMVIEVPE